MGVFLICVKRLGLCMYLFFFLLSRPARYQCQPQQPHSYRGWTSHCDLQWLWIPVTWGGLACQLLALHQCTTGWMKTHTHTHSTHTPRRRLIAPTLSRPARLHMHHKWLIYFNLLIYSWNKHCATAVCLVTQRLKSLTSLLKEKMTNHHSLYSHYYISDSKADHGNWTSTLQLNIKFSFCISPVLKWFL